MTVTQKIFAIARPWSGVTWDDMVPVMQAEAAHVWSHYERGVLRDAWVRTDALGAVYSLESTPGDAASLLAEQPMARNGLVEFELIPVGPFMPLALLFGTQPRPIPPAPSLASGRTQRVFAIGHLQADTTSEQIGARLAEEARQAWALWKGGLIRESHLRTDRLGAALMLEVAGVAGAHVVLRELPLFKAGLVEFECLALATFMVVDALLEGSLEDRAEPLANPTVHP